MPDLTVVYWRDIPAQVIAGRGRSGVKVPLSGRFEQAIDRAAMREGLAGTDTYLAEWRKVAVPAPTGDMEADARATAERLEAEHDAELLRCIIENGGWRPAE